MKTIMNISKINKIDAIESFLEGNQAIAFAVLGDKHGRCRLAQSTLIRLRYITLSKPTKVMVIRVLIKITGYSRQQMTRLISKYIQTGSVNWHPARTNDFHKKYQRTDTLLLAQTDEIHNTPCGHAIKKICEQAMLEFTKSRSRHSNDNALAESKNGSVVRKLFGCGHNPKKWASKMNEFNSRFLNPHLNYHRPASFL
jgi:hypothetical protein